MEVDGTLVMNEFASYMGNFLVALGFCAIATLILVSAYIFIFKPYDRENDEDF
jgi:hypothetical protein